MLQGSEETSSTWQIAKQLGFWIDINFNAISLDVLCSAWEENHSHDRKEKNTTTMIHIQEM